MLSDFDLSKQSGEPGGAPALIKTSASTGVRLVRRNLEAFRSLMSSARPFAVADGRHAILHR